MSMQTVTEPAEAPFIPPVEVQEPRQVHYLPSLFADPTAEPEALLATGEAYIKEQTGIVQSGENDQKTRWAENKKLDRKLLAARLRTCAVVNAFHDRGLLALRGCTEPGFYFHCAAWPGEPICAKRMEDHLLIARWVPPALSESGKATFNQQRRLARMRNVACIEYLGSLVLENKSKEAIGRGADAVVAAKEQSPELSDDQLKEIARREMGKKRNQGPVTEGELKAALKVAIWEARHAGVLKPHQVQEVVRQVAQEELELPPDGGGGGGPEGGGGQGGPPGGGGQEQRKTQRSADPDPPRPQRGPAPPANPGSTNSGSTNSGSANSGSTNSGSARPEPVVVPPQPKDKPPVTRPPEDKRPVDKPPVDNLADEGPKASEQTPPQPEEPWYVAPVQAVVAHLTDEEKTELQKQLVLAVAGRSPAPMLALVRTVSERFTDVPEQVSERLSMWLQQAGKRELDERWPYLYNFFVTAQLPRFRTYLHALKRVDFRGDKLAAMEMAWKFWPPDVPGVPIPEDATEQERHRLIERYHLQAGCQLLKDLFASNKQAPLEPMGDLFCVVSDVAEEMDRRIKQVEALIAARAEQRAKEPQRAEPI